MLLTRRLLRSRTRLALASCIALVAAGFLLAATGPAAAQTTGAVSGKVVDSTTSLPLANVPVWVYTSTGSFQGKSANTDVSGVYTISGLTPGSYYVRTNMAYYGTLDYVDELYNGPAPTPGLPCTASCVVTSGATVSVAAGQTTANIDFAVEPGGRISGTISPGVFPSGCGLGCGYAVSVYDPSGARVGGTRDYGAASYSVSGLAPGSYFVATANNVGYIDELYNGTAEGLVCEPSCNVTLGVSVQVVAGQTTSGINFTLAPGGRISGTVTDAATGSLLGSATISVYNASGSLVTSTSSNTTTGVFATSLANPLLDGTYYVKASKSAAGYIDELFNDVACFPTCTVTTGTPVTIAQAQSSPATVDFALSQAARLSGNVRDTNGAAIGSVTVQVYSTTGTLVTSGSSSSAGIYTTGVLTPGSYYVRTQNSLGYFNQLYAGILCDPSCTVTSGTPYAAASGINTLDFTLTFAARITGTVFGDGVPLSGVGVDILNAGGASVKSATTNASGIYTASGLQTGSYYVRTRNGLGYLDEIHDNIPCLNCTPASTTATAISVTAGTAGGAGDASVSFDLARGAQIAGRALDDATSAGIASVSIQVYDTGGRLLNTVQTTATGAYATTGLPTGRYFVRATPSTTTNYISALYDAISCVGSCSPTSGVPVEVALGAVKSGIDIALAKGGKISGKVTAAAAGVPLNVSLDFMNEGGAVVSSGSSNATTGVYTSSALPPGRYYARTRGLAAAQLSSQGFINEVYDDIACSGCNPVTGTPISVTADATTPNINFILAPGGRVSGHVTDTTTTQPVQGVTVVVFNQGGLQAASVTTNASGEYTTPDGLVAGDYYARTSNSAGYINRLYNVAPLCLPSCAPTSGTAIPVSTASVAGNIDFALTPGGRIGGMVTDASTGLPVPGVTARVYDSAGTQVTGATTNAAGAFLTAAGLPTGDYFVATTNTAGYINEVHPGIVCLGCSLAATGTPVQVSLGATASGIDFALGRGGRVSGTVTASLSAPAAGAPLQGIVVEVFASPYLLPAVTGTTDRLGFYLTGGGLPSDTAYTVRTTNGLGYINERYDDISCINGCSPEPGGTIAVTAPDTTASIDFALDVDGDQDADGIIGSIDTNKELASDGFSDLPQGGTTAGTIVTRNGWTVSLTDLSPGGIVAELRGTGSGPVVIQACASGGTEDIWLDGAGAKASIVCAADTGSTTVTALAAFPYIELRKTSAGITTILELAPGQAATIGSPAVADPNNLEPVHIRLEDAQGTPIGSFGLDPGESAEAVQSQGGVLSVTVFSGSVDVTVGEETVKLGVGQTRGFEVCAPLEIESVQASPAVLWPPNHKMATVTLSPAWSGTCGTATCQIVSVASNEPADGVGDGDTSPDWEIGEGLTVMLRVERAGSGSGRIYTATIQCTDEAGNVVRKTATVSVPRQR